MRFYICGLLAGNTLTMALFQTAYFLSSLRVNCLFFKHFLTAAHIQNSTGLGMPSPSLYCPDCW